MAGGQNRLKIESILLLNFLREELYKPLQKLKVKVCI